MLVLFGTMLYLNLSFLSTEIFGPVLALQRFKTEEEAIHLANDSNAGLFSSQAHACPINQT